MAKRKRDTFRLGAPVIKQDAAQTIIALQRGTREAKV